MVFALVLASKCNVALNLYRTMHLYRNFINSIEFLCNSSSFYVNTKLHTLETYIHALVSTLVQVVLVNTFNMYIAVLGAWSIGIGIHTYIHINSIG